MTAEEARKASLNSQFKGVDPKAQRETIDGLIEQATGNGLFEVKFTNMHPDTKTGLIADGYNLAGKDGSSEIKISW